MKPLYYKEQGEGSALVLLHGFCETHEIWENIFPELSTKFKVIALDLPGFGKSDPLSLDFSIKKVGRSVTDLLSSIGIQNCVFVGHSLGGYVALTIAQERPDLVAGLCLFHSTALPDNDEKKINRNRVIDFVEKNGALPFVETFVPGLFFKKDQKNMESVYKIASKTSKNSIIAYSRAMRDRPDMTDFLMEFFKPVLFVGGENDSFLRVPSLEGQAKLAVAGEVKILAGTGHMGMYEATSQSIRILKDFAGACFHSIAL